MRLLEGKRAFITLTKFYKGPTTLKGFRIANLEPLPDTAMEVQYIGGQLPHSPKISISITVKAGITCHFSGNRHFSFSSFVVHCSHGFVGRENRLRSSLKKIKWQTLLFQPMLIEVFCGWGSLTHTHACHGSKKGRKDLSPLIPNANQQNLEICIGISRKIIKPLTYFPAFLCVRRTPQRGKF